MKRILFIPFVVLSLVSLVSAQVKHVVLITVDGSRPEFYEDKSWPAPILRSLKAKGAYAANGVQSVFPSVTYPSHTTVITGAYPARHGVYYNTPTGAKAGHWYWNESYIKTKTLWDAVKEAGMTSAAFMWPVSVGAPIDYNFPVRRPEKDEKGDVIAVTRPVVTPASLLTEMEQKAIGRKLTAEDFKGDYSPDEVVAKMANYVLETYKPNLTAIHFLSVDHTGHAYGRDAKQVKKAVALVDSLIGTVLQTIEKAGLKENTAIIITGDHGMVDNATAFAPNVYLAQNGLISGKQWTAKFRPAGGSAFLYLQQKNDKATLNKVEKILSGLPASQKKLFRIVDRKELDKIGANPDIALALAMKEGTVAIGDESGEAFRARKKGGNHGYHPEIQKINTMFIATGAGITPQSTNITGMGIKDIAPIVARLLGLDFNAPDGVLLPGIVK